MPETTPPGGDRPAAARSAPDYDPWRDLEERWPEISVVREPMYGRLLGELRYPLIALREDSSPAQQRCTLAHEIVHLERGVTGCSAWLAAEERHVHDLAARRLLPFARLRDWACSLAAPADIAAMARDLDVDTDTAHTRLGSLSATEWSELLGLTAGL